MTAVASCRACGTELLESARFCHACGAPTNSSPTAEYKQVTVLFADVVRSMNLAASVGPERLREIMAELVRRAAAVVQRYGGTIDKFTGDGIMALFGAPVALEDHAFRACVASLGIQEDAAKLAVDIKVRDGVDLALRIGLNSGQVIAGELGSGPVAYTAVGEQVGMAQRMESAAPAGGIMLSESTSRLVENSVVLSEPQLVHVKGAHDPVPARRLLASSERHEAGRQESTSLIGRTWEMNTISGILDEAIGGAGCIVCVVGPPGIGKSRIIRESATLAGGRGVEVFTTYCESHTSDIPFHAVARLLRAGIGVAGFDSEAARRHVRERVPGANTDDLLMLDDLLGIADSDIEQPMIEADARRRRLTAMINGVALARRDPALYVIEDVHWIDDVSESMLADFLPVISQTRSTVLITYRPEYRGALTRVPGAQAISLRPLNSTQATTLIGELLGPEAMAGTIPERIAERAAGNPFFAEEIVRDLAERGVIEGTRGSYSARGDVGEVNVPATLQATIAARIDRLEPTAKRTLGAAAVVGMRFGREALESLGIEPVFDDLVSSELIDQVQFTPDDEYAFRHPLIRAVAYETQLTADRAKLHRRLAAAIQARDPDAVDENAALVAEHLEAAGDLDDAFEWHMKSGAWLTNRDIAAARTSWQKARQIADRLPADIPERGALRIAPRTLLCTSAYRGGGSVDDTGFQELRELCTAAGDEVSLAIGMAGLPVTLMLQNNHREAARLASEQGRLLESIGDPTLSLGLLHAAMTAKLHAGELAEALQMEQRVIDLADGDVHKGEMLIGSPLAQATMLRGLTRCCLGDRRWKHDIDDAVDLARTTAAWTQVVTLAYPYVVLLPAGALSPDETAMTRTAAALQIAEHAGDNFTVGIARNARADVLLWHDPHRAEGLELLAVTRESAERNGNRFGVLMVDIRLAGHMLRTEDLTGAVEMARAIVDELSENGEMIMRSPAATVLIESLLRRGTDADVAEAAAAIDRLAAVPPDAGFVLYELHLLRVRALLAQAREDAVGYQEWRDRYRDVATTLGFEGHIQLAAAMP